MPNEVTQADERLMSSALARALKVFEKNRPTPGNMGAISYLMIEGAQSCADARAEERQTLAEALTKFAPDLADELIKRWTAAIDKSDQALTDLLAVLKDGPR